MAEDVERRLYLCKDEIVDGMMDGGCRVKKKRWLVLGMGGKRNGKPKY